MGTHAEMNSTASSRLYAAMLPSPASETSSTIARSPRPDSAAEGVFAACFCAGAGDGGGDFFAGFALRGVGFAGAASGEVPGLAG